MNAPIVIGGTGPLAAATKQQLRERGVAVVRLETASLHDASVLVLADDSDSGNVDLALQTRRAHPSLPLVVRLFDDTLAAYLMETIPGVTVLMLGRWRVRGRGHAIVVGAGNIGYRIAEMLAPHVPDLVILERDADNRNVAALRADGRHTFIADATNEDMLELAGLDKAAVVVAVTDVDAVNLQIALRASERKVPVIMRVLSPELSAHVSQRGEWVAFSPILAAARAFAEAAVAAAEEERAGLLSRGEGPLVR